MAKMKLKLDLKGLLKAHAEKLVAALVAVLVLMVIWNGIGREQLEASKSPEALMKKVDTAKQSITRTKWNAFTQRPELKDYNNRSIMDKIVLDPYATKNVLDNPVIQHKVKRGDPQLLSVGELEVNAGFGAFAVVDERRIELRKDDPSIDIFKIQQVEDRGSRGGMFEKQRRDGFNVGENDLLTGIRFAIVTGLVPVAEQQDQYNTVFQSAIGYDPHNDVPIYLGYVVERRDVAEDGTGSEWAMKMVFQPSTLRQQAIAWAGGVPEVVDHKYTIDRLTYPLGPLVLRNWGREVGHSKIAMAGKQAPMLDEPKPKPRVEPAGPEMDDFGNPKPKQRPTPQPEEKKQEVADVKLLRYFDFAVEPGKRYQYRFRLVLRDPNTIREKATSTSPSSPAPAGKEAQQPTVPNTMLKQEVIDRIKDPKTKKNMRFTEWSEPSPVVSIPYDNRLLVGEIEPASRTSDAQVTVMVKSFDIEKGTEIVGKEKFARGSVIRFTQDVTIVDPKSGKAESIKQYSFDPQAIVLDIRGGKKIDAPLDEKGGKRKTLSLNEPGEVLIQDQTGRLVVHRELADAQEIKDTEGNAVQGKGEEPDSFLGGAAPPPARDPVRPSGKASKKDKDAGIDGSGLIDSGTPKKARKTKGD